MKFERLIVVTRKTRLQELLERFNTVRQAQFYIETAGGNFSEYVQEHEAYQLALHSVQRQLASFELKRQLLDRATLPSIRIGSDEILVTLGQDGIVANAAKYAGGQPIIGLNPDPARFDGVLLPFHHSQLAEVLGKVLTGKEARRSVTLGQVRLNDGQTLLAFNDFFLGARTHVSARYQLTYGSGSEGQSSSGVIVATGAGSTGWLSSVFNMAARITEFSSGQKGRPVALGWDSPSMIFAVREPFVSKHSSAALVMGVVDRERRLVIESRMAGNGVIFSDGMEADFLEFNSGRIAEIAPAGLQAQLVA